MPCMTLMASASMKVAKMVLAPNCTPMMKAEKRISTALMTKSE